MTQTPNNEIDLLKVFQMFWDRKWLITAFTLIATMIGVTIFSYKEETYESKLSFTIDNIPPFNEYDKRKVKNDFDNKFYSKKVFDDWVKNNGKNSLVFDDFSRTEVIDGFVLSKKTDTLNVEIIFSNKKKESYILIKSNELLVLKDFFNYSNYVNHLLAKEYFHLANNELKIIETNFNNTSVDQKIANFILSNKIYVDKIQKGAKVFTIQYPSKPTRTSLGLKFILALSVILGVMTGAIYVIFFNTIRKLRE